jgi:hypothetical protein
MAYDIGIPQVHGPYSVLWVASRWRSISSKSKSHLGVVLGPSEPLPRDLVLLRDILRHKGDIYLGHLALADKLCDSFTGSR